MLKPFYLVFPGISHCTKIHTKEKRSSSKDIHRIPLRTKPQEAPRPPLPLPISFAAAALARQPAESVQLPGNQPGLRRNCHGGDRELRATYCGADRGPRAAGVELRGGLRGLHRGEQHERHELPLPRPPRSVRRERKARHRRKDQGRRKRRVSGLEPGLAAPDFHRQIFARYLEQHRWPRLQYSNPSSLSQ